MSREVVIPGARDVRGSLDGPDGAAAIVVACPPHPQAGGSRSNPMLRALGTDLADRSIATLRFDYGPWADGNGEVRDAVTAVEWAVGRGPAVGLFGYSFGATVALAAAVDVPVVAVSALAPAHRLPNIDTVAALDAVTVPVQLLYAERDRVVDSGPVADRARELGHAVVGLPADHHFVGQHESVAARVGTFFEPRFGD